MEFNGRHVVVTGAANGIGRALAQRFHGEGARVVAADRDADALAAVVDQLNAARPGEAVAVAVDLGTEAGNHTGGTAEDSFGAIDLFFAKPGSPSALI